MGESSEIKDGTYGLIEKPNIPRLRFGNWEMNTWYGTAVYFGRDHKTLGFRYSLQSRSKLLVNKDDIWLPKLFVCDDCFKYTDSEDELEAHCSACDHKDRQQGKIQYLDTQYTIRRVRGSRHKLWAQNLCLFTKLFLDNKSMFFAVDLFDFYVVYDNTTNKPMGFFSKERLSPDRNNLACILVFPPYQRRQLGTLLIAFSYELSKAERLISGPEKPLSPFGLVGYLQYWSNAVYKELVSFKRRSATLDELAKSTGIRNEDILTTLKYMGILVERGSKVYIQKQRLEQWVAKSKKHPLNSECLVID